MDDEVEALSGSEWWRLRMGLGKRRPGSGLDEDWTSRVGEGGGGEVEGEGGGPRRGQLSRCWDKKEYSIYILIHPYLCHMDARDAQP